MQNALLMLGLLWIIGLWTITSPLPASDYLKNAWALRRLISIGITILFLFQIYTGPPKHSPWFTPGSIVFFAGIALASWAKYTMRNNWGEPGQHDSTKQQQLVTNGPFAYSRNPIYIGLLLIVIGFELAVGSTLIVLSIPLAYLIHRAVLKEESLLLKHFGKQYADYQKRVKRYG